MQILKILIVILTGIDSAIFISSSSVVAAPTTMIVDVQSDGVDLIPGDGSCATMLNNCSLRATIQEANVNSHEDNVSLGSGIFLLSLPGTSEDDSLGGDLDVQADLSIHGAGVANTVIDAGEIDRVFDIFPDVQIEISDLTIRNGRTIAAEDGGAIFNRGHLTLRNVVISGNVSDRYGGGIQNMPGATLILDNVRIVDNASFNGGGIDNAGGGVQMRLGEISNNRATSSGFNSGVGGGFYNGGTASLTQVTIDNNAAKADGGGIYNDGYITITQSTLSNNSATFGAGIHNQIGDVVLVNSTLSNNTATNDGGGLYNLDNAVLTNVTVSHNMANKAGGLYNFSALTIANSIVGINGGGNCTILSPITSSGYNLSSDNSCSFSSIGDIEDSNPLLGGLRDNGGNTKTRLPVSTSPVIDAVGQAFCPNADQRERARPVSGGEGNPNACDIGAVEYGSTEPPVAVALINLQAVSLHSEWLISTFLFLCCLSVVAWGKLEKRPFV